MPFAKKLCAVLMIVFSAALAGASGVSLTLSPNNGAPSTNLQIAGGGFPASIAVDIYFDTTDMALAVTGTTGGFSGIAIKVPASAVPGTHWVTAVARGTSGKAAQAAFTVQTNWDQFQYSALRKGSNPYENVLSPATVGSIDVDWMYTTGGAVQSSPAVVNGTVYFGSNDANIYAVSASTGALVWKYATGGAITFSSPSVLNGVVYIGSTDNSVYAINASTGVLVWKYTTGGQVSSSPAVANGTVYIGSGDGSVYALNAGTGALTWKYTTGAAIYVGSPAVANGTVYIGSEDYNVYALNANTGALRWKYATGLYVLSTPTFANGLIYVSSADGYTYALSASRGTVQWQTATEAFYGSLAFANGVLYGNSTGGYVFALDAHTGSTLWTYGTGGFNDSAAIVVNGVVYCGVAGIADGTVPVLDAQTGALLWQYTTGNYVEATPAAVNGVVYAGSDDGNLYAFDLSGGSLAKTFMPPARPKPARLIPNLALRPIQPQQQGAEQ
jgi:outer membrane protein assembly factor BamB